jgi:uncharacterized protein YdaU (DUF1376 family)
LGCVRHARNLLLDKICVKYYFQLLVENPWIAWYPGDYINKTRTLTMAQHGAYLLLLWEYYINGPFLAKATPLLNVCQSKSEADAADVQLVLDQFFVRKGDFYHHERADEEIAKRVSIREQRKLYGQKGGLAKASRLLEQKASTSSSKNLHNHNHSNTKPNPPISPPPPRNGSNGILTVRDRRRLNEEIWRLMDKNCAMPLEEALQTACAELLLPIESARAAVDQAGMGDGLKKGKKK